MELYFVLFRMQIIKYFGQGYLGIGGYSEMWLMIFIPVAVLSQSGAG
jgi:hypothetical protein